MGPPSQETIDRVLAAIRSHPWPADRMIRIASCESGLDPYARNGSHVGIFQISGATPGLIESHVDLAFSIWQRRGFEPWECRG